MRVFGWFFALISLVSPKVHDDFLLVNSKQFTVQGNTSIGGFECHYQRPSKDTLFINKPGDIVSYSIPVREFGCGNFMLNHDFRKTLKAKEFPEIHIDFLHLKRQKNQLFCDVRIRLAGTTKVYKNVLLEKVANEIRGELTLNFSDFKLTPPKKVGGMVKVKEEIKIILHLQA